MEKNDYIKVFDLNRLTVVFLRDVVYALVKSIGLGRQQHDLLGGEPPSQVEYRYQPVSQIDDEDERDCCNQRDSIPSLLHISSDHDNNNSWLSPEPSEISSTMIEVEGMDDKEFYFDLSCLDG